MVEQGNVKAWTEQLHKSNSPQFLFPWVSLDTTIPLGWYQCYYNPRTGGMPAQVWNTYLQLQGGFSRKTTEWGTQERPAPSKELRTQRAGLQPCTPLSSTGNSQWSFQHFTVQREANNVLGRKGRITASPKDRPRSSRLHDPAVDGDDSSYWERELLSPEIFAVCRN